MGKALIVSAGNNANEYLARHIGDGLGSPAPRLLPAAAGTPPHGPKRLEVVIINTPLPDGGSAMSWAPTRVQRPTPASFCWPRPAPPSRSPTSCRISVCWCWASRSRRSSSGRPYRSRPATTSGWPCCAAGNAKLLDKIAQLRLVDRAKCYLIEKKGMTETEAHRLIEKGAMDTRRSRGEGRLRRFWRMRRRNSTASLPPSGEGGRGPPEAG